MKKLDWVKGILEAVTTALSTATPDMWADGRVIAVASSAFLLSAFDTIGSELETASREELETAFEDGFAELSGDLRKMATEARLDTQALDELRGELIEELVNLSLRVEAWGLRFENLDQDVDLILERLAVVEGAVADRPDATGLRGLRDQVYDLPLFERNSLQDRLNKGLTQSELNTVIGRVGLDVDNIGGRTKEEMAGELVDKCRRLGILGRLVGELEARLRPPP